MGDANQPETMTRSQGYRVPRSRNNDGLTSVKGVLETVSGAVAALLPPHPPRFARRPLPASGER